MSAGDNSSYLSHTLAYAYDPRDRIAAVTKDGTLTESYTHDASDNVTAQTVGGATTTFGYDRNRLLTATTGGATANYNYDPSGRLDTVTAGGQILQSNTYDGFDHIVSHQQQNATGGTDTTTYTYDPLNRQTSQTTGGKETDFAYLGLSSDLITESSPGALTKSYDYTPGGARLSQTTHNSDGSTANGYYTYNDHSDVEAVTSQSGVTTATYGYTAYGQNDKAQFTGADKATATGTSTAQPFNAYRYNAMRWDSTTAQYDMGFRTYDPSLNQFLSRDMYNGALNDTGLTTDPFTGNRYTFGAGNPITNIELDGHRPACDGPDEAACMRGWEQAQQAAIRAQAGWNNSPETAPQVSNEELQNILDSIYARPGQRVWQTGKVGDALLREKETGQPFASASGRIRWHAIKASNLFYRLTNLLRSNVLDSSEKGIALSELQELGGAIKAPDTAGKLSEFMKANSSLTKEYNTNLRNASINLKAVAQEQAASAAQGANGAPAEEPPGEEPPPEGGSLGDAAGGIAGTLGWLLMIIDAQRHGGMFSQGGCQVFGIPASVCPYTPQGSI